MTIKLLKKTLGVLLALAPALLSSCTEDNMPIDGDGALLVDGPAKVGLLLGSSTPSRSTINDSADGFLWSPGDKISVWAKNAKGTYVLQNQVFDIYARQFNEQTAYFTSTLPSAMAEGTYTYYITYPVPASVSGTKAIFEVPAVQDGKASYGTDITISSGIQHKELTAVEEPDPIGQSTDAMEASLHHILHFLRFYIPKGNNLLGEPITKIKFSMPNPIAGTITVDVTDPSQYTLSNGTSEMTIEIADGLEESSSTKEYAVAGILPPEGTYGSAEVMNVTLFSANKVATVTPVSISGRSFAAGHVTGVPLKPSSIKDYFTLKFTLASNKLGEDVQSVTLTLPEGSVWPGTTSRTFTYSKEEGIIPVGETFNIATIEESEFRAVSKKGVTVTYESEDAIVSESLTLADLSKGSQASASLNVPYLFSEDFSSLAADFHSDDEYSGGFVTGDKSATEFMTGWSGGRVGGQAGTSIRITCRREVSARYGARCDSPFMTGLKHTAEEFKAMGKDITLKVKFNYSMNREEGGLFKGEIGQTLYFGSTNATGLISSGSETGSFDSGTAIKETTGSFTNVNHEASYSLDEMGSDYRLSWRTYPDYYALGNSSCYLYIDNITVTIEK